MKIQAVYIDGFKNISNVNLTLENITALVALNNFGKSNVLSAINLGLTFIKSSTDDKESIMANSKLIPINKYNFGKNYKFQIEAVTKVQMEEYRIQYGYEFSWKIREDEPACIVSEYLRIRNENRSKKYTRLINRDRKRALYKSSEAGRCSTEIRVENSELAINKLRAYDELFYSTIIKKINNMRFYMENNFDVKNFYDLDPIIWKGFDGLAIDSKNLPRVIYNLNKEYPHKFAVLKEIFKSLFPNIEDIIVKEYAFENNAEKKLPKEVPFIVQNVIYALYVKDKNLINPINFSMMSDGAKRIFMILTRIILASVSNVSLIAIEEPENSVHPGLFQAYIRIINQLLDDCKVIITSHSPYVISYFDLGWIYVGISRNPGVAEFLPFKKNGQKLMQHDAELFKMSTGDYLFSMLSDSDNNWEDYLECGSDE